MSKEFENRQQAQEWADGLQDCKNYFFEGIDYGDRYMVIFFKK